MLDASVQGKGPETGKYIWQVVMNVQTDLHNIVLRWVQQICFKAGTFWCEGRILRDNSIMSMKTSEIHIFLWNTLLSRSSNAPQDSSIKFTFVQFTFVVWGKPKNLFIWNKFGSHGWNLKSLLEVKSPKWDVLLTIVLTDSWMHLL